jgi:uncharacterized membrane protein YfcA
VTLADAAWGIVIGLGAGILSGMFGVGGGIVMTPAIDATIQVPAIQTIATPLPVIFPTSITGAYTYAKAGEVDRRAAGWMASLGLIGSFLGAYATEWIDPTLLLLVTAVLLGWQSIRIIQGPRRQGTGAASAVDPGHRSPAGFAAIGAAAGTISGLLGIGGGLIMVPLLSGWAGMPLKRALGTSLLTIPALVVPGTIVHAWLGNIDWGLAVFLAIGAVPGARLGATIALGTAEHTLRRIVGSGMLAMAVLYAARQLLALVR